MVKQFTISMQNHPLSDSTSMSYEVRRIRPVGRIRVGSGWERKKETGKLARTVAGDQGVVTALEHDTGVILDEWKGVSMEVTEHGVAAPAADDANFIRIHASQQEGRATSAERPCCNVCRINAGMPRNSEGSSPKEAHDHVRGDSTSPPPFIIVDMEGCGWRSLVVIEVDDPSCNGTDGTSRRLAIGRMSQLLPFDPVLLNGKGEGGEGSSQQLGQGGLVGMKEMLIADLNFHIRQAKGVLGIARGIGILAGTEKKIEGHPNTVDGSLITSRRTRELSRTE